MKSRSDRRPIAPLSPGRYVLTRRGNLFPVSHHVIKRAVAIVTVKARPMAHVELIEVSPPCRGHSVPMERPAPYVPGVKINLAGARSSMEALAETWRRNGG